MAKTDRLVLDWCVFKIRKYEQMARDEMLRRAEEGWPETQEVSLAGVDLEDRPLYQAIFKRMLGVDLLPNTEMDLAWEASSVRVRALRNDYSATCQLMLNMQLI